MAQILDGAKRSFDAAPEPERLEVFDSQLAAETRTSALRAILLSWLAIMLYLWFRFHNWTFGLAAVICLVHDLCFTLGAIAACHYLHLVPGLNFLGIQDFKIDLAAVAALLTLVGYSVNEIIVNFARIREVRGKNPLLTPQMINDSVNQTLSRTILTSMTVLLVSIVLYAFGGEGVHLFAFVMMMGVMVSTYSSIFVASPLLLFLGEGREGATDAEAAARHVEEAEAGSPRGGRGGIGTAGLQPTTTKPTAARPWAFSVAVRYNRRSPPPSWSTSMSSRLALAVVLLAFGQLARSAEPVTAETNLIFRNATIYDGTGKPPVKGDVSREGR